VPHLRRSGFLSFAFPALPHWAKFFRPPIQTIGAQKTCLRGWGRVRAISGGRVAGPSPRRSGQSGGFPIQGIGTQRVRASKGAHLKRRRGKEEGFFDCASRPEIGKARFPGKKRRPGRFAQNDNERRRQEQCAHLKGGRYKGEDKGEEKTPPSQNEDGAPGKASEGDGRGVRVRDEG
jgi:hypothetical protein